LAGNLVVAGENTLIGGPLKRGDAADGSALFWTFNQVLRSGVAQFGSFN
jgi:hypothetical protein